MSFTPGTLVNLRDRDWVVMPSNDPDLLLVKPLGGSEDETTGIYLPLAFADDKPKETVFPPPTSARLIRSKRMQREQLKPETSG